MSTDTHHTKSIHQSRNFSTDSSKTDESMSNAPHVHRHVDEYSEVMRALPATTNPLIAFAPKPVNMRFATQDTQEQILLLLRKHPITQLLWVIIAGIGVLIPVFVDPGQLLSFLPPNYQVATTITWYVAILFYVLESFISWYYNVYIITDERVVDIDFLSLIYRNISSAKLNRIEDVTARTHGALQTVVNYGTVTIQTAGTAEEFEFEDVPRPNTIVQLINELLQEEELETIQGRVS